MRKLFNSEFSGSVFEDWLVQANSVDVNFNQSWFENFSSKFWSGFHSEVSSPHGVASDHKLFDLKSFFNPMASDEPENPVVESIASIDTVYYPGAPVETLDPPPGFGDFYPTEPSEPVASVDPGKTVYFPGHGTPVETIPLPPGYGDFYPTEPAEPVSAVDSGKTVYYPGAPVEAVDPPPGFGDFYPTEPEEVNKVATAVTKELSLDLQAANDKSDDEEASNDQISPVADESVFSSSRDMFFFKPDEELQELFRNNQTGWGINDLLHTIFPFSWEAADSQANEIGVDELLEGLDSNLLNVVDDTQLAALDQDAFTFF